MKTVLLFFFVVTIASSTSFYVSPSGNDNNPGSIDKPFQTIQKAQSAVRSVNKNAKDDITVFLRDGRYVLEAPLTFTPEDSGFNGHQVIYRQYNTEKPIISGEKAITGWKLQDQQKNLWAVQMDANLQTRQLYINDVRQSRARSQKGIPGTVKQDSTGYTTTDTSMATWKNPSTIEFVYTGQGSMWTEPRVLVNTTAVQSSKLVFTMQQPAYANGLSRIGGSQAIKLPAYIENAFELLDEPGEWYFDISTNMLYSIPLPGVDMASASVLYPLSQGLLVAQGDITTSPISPVENLAFSGITFTYAGWTAPSGPDGYIDIQSGVRFVGSPQVTVMSPGSVAFHTAQHITVQECIFEHLGAVGLAFDQGSQDLTILDNSFTDLSCGAVQVGQVDDPKQDDPSKQHRNVLVKNNLVRNLPAEYHSCAAILGGYMANFTIANNDLANTSNTAISVGWGWGTYSYAANNLIYGNRIDRSNWLLQDGGSIYTLSAQNNSEVSYNYISNQVKLYGSLYHDEGSAYFHTHHNVVDNGPEWLHIWTSSIHDIVVETCWTNQKYYINKGTNITLQNITYVDGENFPEDAKKIMEDAGIQH